MRITWVTHGWKQHFLGLDSSNESQIRFITSLSNILATATLHYGSGLKSLSLRLSSNVFLGSDK